MDSLFNANKWKNKMPPQQLSFSKKNRAWRKACVDFGDSKTFFNYSPVRNSVIHKKINYDLLNGKLHMEDLKLTINPENIKEKDKDFSEEIQHYPIMNTKLEVLRGEELARVFDFRVVVTNPLAISEKEENKKNQILQRLQQLIMDQSQSEEEYQQNIDKMADFFTFEWQDMREVRANCLLKHYMKEYNVQLMFNQGFMDALSCGEEIYQCDIRGGEPIIERVNPLKIRVFKSGFSNRIEDADIVIIEDYWSPAKIIDTYYDVLTKKDREYIENGSDRFGAGSVDSLGRRDERDAFVNATMIDDVISTEMVQTPFGYFDDFTNTDLMPFDTNGNIKVMRMYWKSRRKIKKVKSYDPQTGEEMFNFFPETYVINKEAGEEETIYYINEAWEGTKIGDEVYVNMRPRIVQYNRLSNPSRCHFGIIGTIYNLNDSKPYSIVDRMKSYNYLYDAVHDRLNKLMAKNWGKIITLDLAKVPKDWTMDKWLYFAKHNNIAVIDSFKEGNRGAATGKLAGALNNASSGVIDAELGNTVINYIQVLQSIKEEMSDVAGISRQREGQISNRETVGGVERATLQSSHITEWLFATHDDVKRRALECFLETAKAALKGRNEKFQYLLSDGQERIVEIEGDEFAEADYGLVIDNSNGAQDLNQRIEGLAQAALQNQLLTFSSLMKLYTTDSLIEKQRMIERAEKEAQERSQQAQEQQMQTQQQQMQMQAQMKQAQMEQEDMLNQRDNETKIVIANINAASHVQEPQEETYSQEAKDKLAESMRQFDAKLKLDRERLAFDKHKAELDHELKRKQIAKKTSTNK